MVAPLVQAGRGDLAKVIESKLTDLEQAKVREKRRAALKRFEKKYLFGAWSKLRSSGSG
jgi:hypothetical protein